MRSRRHYRGKQGLGGAAHARREAASLAAAAGIANCPRPDKRRFPNKKEAKAAIRKQSLAERDTLHAYRCPCGGFHIGHRRRLVVVPPAPALELELGAGEAAA